MKKHNIAELNRMYEEAEGADQEIFAEMRSNLLLVSGNHYSKKADTFFNRVRNSQRINENQKLRITKNHIHKVTRHYINSILSKAPGVTVSPQNDLEMQDRKSAELNKAVWEDGKRKYNFKELFKSFVHNFVEIGETCCFMYFDPHIGETTGFEPMVDEMGMPVLDPMTGQPQEDKSKPIKTGGFQFKNIPGFNLLRAPSANSMEGSPYHTIREMVDKAELEASYGNDPEKLKIIGEGDPQEFVVFDTNKKEYRNEHRQVLLKYTFFRPCQLYPNGYYYIFTERGILEEQELPFGLYPIIWEGFDTYATNPRGFSVIKVARPFQAEINRAASQAATHQITVGDDKIIYQGGTKLAPGALLPGVRGITYQGIAPQILPGRDGGQFLPYIESQIQEMYSACMIEEINMENESGQIDPYTLLFRSASQQQKFARYTEKIENFMKKFCMLYLDLCRHYLSDDTFIQAVGKSEAINIAEFRVTSPLCYKIKIDEQSEAVDTKLGKQIALNHVLQYVGAQLGPKQIGLIVKEMPFLNNKMLFKTMSSDYDNVENDMLAMERGEQPFISPFADNQIYIESVTHRMKQADFRLLPQQVQQAYDEYLQVHEMEQMKKERAIQAAKDGFIPTGGSLITCSMQVKDPSSASGTRQVRLPYESLNWLIQKLEAQGSALQTIDDTNPGVIARTHQPAQLPQGQGDQVMTDHLPGINPAPNM